MRRGGWFSAKGACTSMTETRMSGTRVARASKDVEELARGFDEAPEVLSQNVPLIPADTIASRALVTVVAIMAFLASLAAGAGLLISDEAAGWRESVSRELTIQIKPRSGRDIEADVAAAAAVARASSGVASARVYDKAESEALLRPWLGQGLDFGDLPIPRLIVIERKPAATIDLGALTAELTRRAPTALLDDHAVWMERLATMADVMVAIVGIIFGLVLAAMILAVSFATRAAMAGAAEIVSVLHFVGAEDSFIAGQFQRHFLRLGLRGGCFGGGAAMVVFAVSSWLLSRRVATPDGDQIQALFGAFALGATGYLAIATLAVGIAALTAIISRLIVLRQLRVAQGFHVGLRPQI